MTTPVIMSSVRAVIFDCDGVLVDSWRSTKHYFNSIRASVGLDEMNAEQEGYCFMHTVPVSVAYIVPEDRLEEAMETAVNFPFEEELAPLLHLNPGIVDLLRRLRASGRKLAVNTNAGPEQHIILGNLGIHDQFDMIVTTEDVVQGKPSPEGIQLILTRFGLAPEQAVFVGDSKLDMQAALAANVPFWGYGQVAPGGAVNLTSFAAIRIED